MSMSPRDVEDVVQSIPHDAPHVRIVGKRTYDGGRSFVLDCVDTRTDKTFAVYDLDDWWARVLGGPVPAPRREGLPPPQSGREA